MGRALLPGRLLPQAAPRRSKRGKADRAPLEAGPADPGSVTSATFRHSKVIPDDLVKFTSHEAEGETNPLGVPVLESGQRTARAVSSSFFCNNSRLPREERFSSPQSDTLRF